ncbi:MAG: HD domain-containing protein, partial [Oscillospiraceae bacterium]|nr:HD domain-containing protein [Oscillospiraceae bacterium]
MQRIIEEIRSEVNKICEQYKETTNDDCSKHIHAVVAISEQLADKFNADKEIVVLGAYLHDVSCPAQYGSLDEHHIYSSQLAEKMLNKKNYPKERTERVIKCVLHHRGSKMEVKETIEEECVADA